jgi:hypothetical protein
MKIKPAITIIMCAPAFAWIFFWLGMLNPERARELARAVEELSKGTF